MPIKRVLATGLVPFGCSPLTLAQRCDDHREHQPEQQTHDVMLLGAAPAVALADLTIDATAPRVSVH